VFEDVLSRLCRPYGWRARCTVGLAHVLRRRQVGVSPTLHWFLFNLNRQPSPGCSFPFFSASSPSEQI
jgi:hypothetical protein